MPRLSIAVTGVVQGVGFRPFVHAAATRHGLSGWVRNHAGGVHLEVEGDDAALAAFLADLERPPPAARVDRIEARPVRGAAGPGAVSSPSRPAFEIAASDGAAPPRPTLPPDLAICDACAREMDTAGERRHGYPFTNCTRCGPRYSIILALPYDRARTTMAGFDLCPACAAEYHDPGDRRFHAQPIACPACGPTVRLLAVDGRETARGDAAVEEAAAALARRRIVALKGLGGYQLLCDAGDDAAVARLRRCKARDEKPFAVMFPSLASLRRVCDVSAVEEQALLSPEAPILLVRKRTPGNGTDAGRVVSPGVAPRNPFLGAMLPYTPLHRLLLGRFGGPVVCTSGNLSEEPMCTADDEALERLGAVADVFVVHDRPIHRPVDDSVARFGPAGLELLRRARGFAPLPLRLSPPAAGDRRVLALGGQLKNTVALVADGHTVVSQHVGDLSSAEGAALCARVAEDLVHFFDTRPERVACDLHPDYASTRIAERLARRWGAELVPVQHHHAHVAAVLAEHGLAGPVLGLAWDGTGLGPDGTLWGGEALVVNGAEWRRVAHLRPFSLPGGEAAIREPRRSAAGLLHAVFGPGFGGHLEPAGPSDAVLARMLETGLNSPRTTSIGRLFDAVAALAGVRDAAGFEGQAAMELEHAADGVEDDVAYPVPLGAGELAVADWAPLLRALLDDVGRGVPAGMVSARFHNGLAALAVAVADRARLDRVALSGGCFQNLRLTAAVTRRLTGRGFEVFAPRLYPANDGGLALGQAFVAVVGG